MVKAALRIILIVVALIGLFLMYVGIQAAGTSIALPGLGLIIAGELFLVLGIIILATALLANILLNRWKPYR